MTARGTHGAVVLLVGALAACAAGGDLAPPAGAADPAAATGAPAAGPELARRGELLFNIGGCTSCHTVKDGPPLAGGDPIRTEFGTFYAPNLTPDREHGIGGWSEADFIRAMREGRSPDGAPYYPSLPYTSYTKMTDEDLRALKAYLDTVPPSAQPSRPHELKFPYNQRWGMRLWQAAYFEPERFAPDPSKGEAWNRGAYLVEGPGHCNECHTPRNFAGVLQHERAFAGAPAPARSEGAPGADGAAKPQGSGGGVPNISGDKDKGLGNWSEQDIVNSLSIGMLPDGDFIGGEMAKVVNNGTSKLPPEDLAAIATYLKSLPARQ
jgi:mono/diheme cytochrome c family protein